MLVCSSTIDERSLGGVTYLAWINPSSTGSMSSIVVPLTFPTPIIPSRVSNVFMIRLILPLLLALDPMEESVASTPSHWVFEMKKMKKMKKMRSI